MMLKISKIKEKRPKRTKQIIRQFYIVKFYLSTWTIKYCLQQFHRGNITHVIYHTPEKKQHQQRSEFCCSKSRAVRFSIHKESHSFTHIQEHLW